MTTWDMFKFWLIKDALLPAILFLIVVIASFIFDGMEKRQGR